MLQWNPKHVCLIACAALVYISEFQDWGRFDDLKILVHFGKQKWCFNFGRFGRFQVDSDIRNVILNIFWSKFFLAGACRQHWMVQMSGKSFWSLSKVECLSNTDVLHSTVAGPIKCVPTPGYLCQKYEHEGACWFRPDVKWGSWVSLSLSTRRSCDTPGMMPWLTPCARLCGQKCSCFKCARIFKVSTCFQRCILHGLSWQHSKLHHDTPCGTQRKQIDSIKNELKSKQQFPGWCSLSWTPDIINISSCGRCLQWKWHPYLSAK